MTFSYEFAMFSVGNKTALLDLMISVKLRIAILLKHNFYQLSRNCDSDLLIKLTSDFNCRDKLEHVMANLSFSKLTISPKIKVKLPNMSDWHNNNHNESNDNNTITYNNNNDNHNIKCFRTINQGFVYDPVIKKL